MPYKARMDSRWPTTCFSCGNPGRVEHHRVPLLQKNAGCGIGTSARLEVWCRFSDGKPFIHADVMPQAIDMSQNPSVCLTESNGTGKILTLTPSRHFRVETSTTSQRTQRKEPCKGGSSKANSTRSSFENFYVQCSRFGSIFSSVCSARLTFGRDSCSAVLFPSSTVTSSLSWSRHNRHRLLLDMV